MANTKTREDFIEQAYGDFVKKGISEGRHYIREGNLDKWRDSWNLLKKQIQEQGGLDVGQDRLFEGDFTARAPGEGANLGITKTFGGGKKFRGSALAHVWSQASKDYDKYVEDQKATKAAAAAKAKKDAKSSEAANTDTDTDKSKYDSGLSPVPEIRQAPEKQDNKYTVEDDVLLGPDGNPFSGIYNGKRYKAGLELSKKDIIKDRLDSGFVQFDPSVSYLTYRSEFPGTQQLLGRSGYPQTQGAFSNKALYDAFAGVSEFQNPDASYYIGQQKLYDTGDNQLFHFLSDAEDSPEIAVFGNPKTGYKRGEYFRKGDNVYFRTGENDVIHLPYLDQENVKNIQSQIQKAFNPFRSDLQGHKGFINLKKPKDQIEEGHNKAVFDYATAFKSGGILKAQQGVSIENKKQYTVGPEFEFKGASAEELGLSVPKKTESKALLDNASDSNKKTSNDISFSDAISNIPDLSTTQQADLAALALDVAGLGAGLTGVGSVASAALGVGSTAATAVSDFTNDEVDFKDASINLLTNLGLDAIATIPGIGAAADTFKIARKLKRILPWTLRLVGAGAAYNAGKDVMDKINRGEDLSLRDIQNAFGVVSALTQGAIGRAGTIKSKVKDPFVSGSKQRNKIGVSKKFEGQDIAKQKQAHVDSEVSRLRDIAAKGGMSEDVLRSNIKSATESSDAIQSFKIKNKKALKYDLFTPKDLPVGQSRAAKTKRFFRRIEDPLREKAAKIVQKNQSNSTMLGRGIKKWWTEEPTPASIPSPKVPLKDNRLLSQRNPRQPQKPGTANLGDELKNKFNNRTFEQSQAQTSNTDQLKGRNVFGLLDSPRSKGKPIRLGGQDQGLDNPINLPKFTKDSAKKNVKQRRKARKDNKASNAKDKNDNKLKALAEMYNKKDKTKKGGKKKAKSKKRNRIESKATGGTFRAIDTFEGLSNKPKKRSRFFNKLVSDRPDLYDALGAFNASQHAKTVDTSFDVPILSAPLLPQVSARGDALQRQAIENIAKENELAASQNLTSNPFVNAVIRGQARGQANKLRTQAALIDSQAYERSKAIQDDINARNVLARSEIANQNARALALKSNQERKAEQLKNYQIKEPYQALLRGYAADAKIEDARKRDLKDKATILGLQNKYSELSDKELSNIKDHYESLIAAATTEEEKKAIREEYNKAIKDYREFDFNRTKGASSVIANVLSDSSYIPHIPTYTKTFKSGGVAKALIKQETALKKAKIKQATDVYKTEQKKYNKISKSFNDWLNANMKGGNKEAMKEHNKNYREALKNIMK